MEYETLRTESEDGVVTVSLHRPDHLNAFTETMAHELIDLLDRAGDDDSTRALIVTGSGAAFCAGMDLSSGDDVFVANDVAAPDFDDLDDLDSPRAAEVRDLGGVLALAIRSCRKPVIAAINGAAVGIGATMTLAMDARLVSTRGRMGLVFGRIGITPEACSTWYLPQIVGLPTALDLMMSADILDADRCVSVGLANSAHDPDHLLPAARALADRWTKGRSPVGVALVRQMLYRNPTADTPVEVHRVESLALRHTGANDGREGVEAFRQKRAPSFHERASHMPPFFRTWISRTGSV
ncbi:enoyl-CoA hydratase-related protein [Gordonia terrae]